MQRSAATGAAFAIATVVSRRGPVSSHMGDRAIVFGDGVMEGFVGGSCSREVVRRQALDALAAGEPRLVSIRPDDELALGGDGVVVPMTCGSKGSVDVYIEPFVQARTVAIVGLTPVADALVRLALTLEYRVVRAVTQEELRDVDDAVSLEELGARLAAMSAGAARLARCRGGLAGALRRAGAGGSRCAPASPYIALVASRRRGDEVRAALLAAGLAPDDVAAIHNPAGLDLGARHPGEVALSILAELVRSHPSPRAFATEVAAPGGDAPAIAIDPICGMEVVVTPEAVSAEVDGETFYFCCDGCRSRYLAQVGA